MVNTVRFERVVEAARAKAEGQGAWLRAIERAEREVAENPYLHWDGHALLVLSPSGRCYEANGECQCRAYTSGRPCWHRAAGRLMARYLERAA